MNNARNPSMQKKNIQEGNTSWIENNFNLADIDMSKLALLNTLAGQGAGKTPNELLPFLMSAVSKGKSKGMQFNPQEMERIIQVLKIGKSPEEVQRMEHIIQMMKLIGVKIILCLFVENFSVYTPAAVPGHRQQPVL